MLRRFSIVCLFSAWLCADGTVLNIAQVFAWARMFAGYVQTCSVSEAAEKAVDPAHPCELCKALQRARQSDQSQPLQAAPAALEKLLLAHSDTTDFVIFSPRPEWPEPLHETPRSRREPVPVPPPRSIACEMS